MHKWVVGAQQVAVQTDEETVATKWTKREKALTVVVVILVGTVGIIWWHVCLLSRTSKALCDSSECIKQAAWMLSTVDTNADPCDNFYDFVCSSKTQLGERLISRDHKTSFEGFSTLAADSSRTDLILTKIRAVYNACMNTEKSDMYFKEFFKSLNRWGLLNHESDTFDWRLFLYKARKHGLKHDMLFTFKAVEDGNNNAYLRIEPPVVKNAPPEVITIFNMSFVQDDSFFDETLRRMATVQEEVVIEMTVEALEYNFSTPSLETILHVTGHNFTKHDIIQLKSPAYFDQLKLQLTKENISQSLHDYLMYEVVRSLIYEYNLTFQTWQSKGDSKIDFCVSKAIDIVPFTTELKYKEKILEIVNIAEDILEEFLLIHGNNDEINDSSITIVTLNEVLDEYSNFPNLRLYMENQEEHNYMQLVTNSQKFKDDCYYSTLNCDENADLACMLYNADDIKIHNNSLVIPAKILEHSFYHTDGFTQLNYAGIGTLIGRVLIRKQLETGNASNASKIMQCLFDQQADFYYIPNGVQEQEAKEMYIDVAGTQLAYRTYLRLDLFNSEEVLPGLEYTKSQLFWLTKFRDQCDYSDNFSQASVLPFVNIDNFTADFFCAEEKYINPTSVPRCSIL